MPQHILCLALTISLQKSKNSHMFPRTPPLPPLNLVSNASSLLQNALASSSHSSGYQKLNQFRLYPPPLSSTSSTHFQSHSQSKHMLPHPTRQQTLALQSVLKANRAMIYPTRLPPPLPTLLPPRKRIPAKLLLLRILQSASLSRGPRHLATSSRPHRPRLTTQTTGTRAPHPHLLPPTTTLESSLRGQRPTATLTRRIRCRAMIRLSRATPTSQMVSSTGVWQRIGRLRRPAGPHTR